MKRISNIIVCLLLFTFSNISAQDTVGKTMIGGTLVTVMLDDNGDTLYLANNLSEVSLTSPRKFNNREEYLRYRKYSRYAAIVYPYAKEAIKIFREADYATLHMKKGKRKKYIKKLQKDLEKEFEEPLRKLSKTQGKIMVKMIERELDQSMHGLIKNLRGGWSAGYWNTMSKFWGYRLKEKYKEGDDLILDAVLQDFNISHRMRGY